MIFRNFFNTLKHYKMASVLNVVGLSAAFAAFAIIMMQVMYDLRFDRFHSNAERIVRVEAQMSAGQPYTIAISRPIQRVVSASSPDIVASGFTYYGSESNLSTDFNSDEYPFREYIERITPSILEIFDFDIIAGDTTGFSLENKWIISETLAEAFYGNENPIGRHTKRQGVDTVTYEILAVYRDFPKNSSMGNHIYQSSDQENYNNWHNWSYRTFLLLAPGADYKVVEQQIIDHTNKELNSDFEDRFRLTPFTDLHFSDNIQYDIVEKANKATVYTLLLIAFLIIAIAVINFINFSTSMVPTRIKNINTQKVLGEATANIRMNMLFEAVGLSVIAVGLSVLLIQFLSTTTFTKFLSAEMALSHNTGIILGTIGVALLSGIIAGIYPAYYITSFPPALVLKGTFGLSPKGRRLRMVLISFQYVVSFTLIIVAIFIHVQSTYMKRHSLGFQHENVLVTEISRNSSIRYKEIGNLMNQNPAVKGIAFAEGILVSNNKGSWGMEYKGEVVFFDRMFVSANFPAVMGIPIAEGRDFQPSDEEKENGSFIFNRAAQRAFKMEVDDRIANRDIVGIVEDFNFRPLQHGIDPIGLYFPGKDVGFSTFSHAYIRVESGNLPSTIDFIRSKMSEIDPDNGRFDLQFLDESIGDLYNKEDRLAQLISVFSLLAILISIIGVFGLIMFENQYRRKEIGIRKIHGATVSEILRLLNRGFIVLTCVCFVVSVPIAYYIISQWLKNFTYRSPVHIWIFVFAFLSLLVLTLLTVTLQSYRTSNENPVKSIKPD